MSALLENERPVAVDALGGDYAPDVVVDGVVRAAQAGRRIILVGPEKELRPQIPKGLPVGFEDAAVAVAMDDSPSSVVRGNERNSIRVALELVRDGRACAMVSCGNTGAVLVGTKIILGTFDGVERPAIATVLPRKDGGSMILLDSGANVDCRPEQLVNFALLGAAYAESSGTDHPRVALLSNGAERSKGNMLVRSTLPMLEALDLDFVGPLEPNSALRGDCDVLVCDGFAGNIFLKAAESAAEMVGGLLKQELAARNRGKLGGWLMKPSLRRTRERLNWHSRGGAFLLGARGAVVVGHGRANAEAVEAAIQTAHQGAKSGLVASIESRIRRMNSQ